METKEKNHRGGFKPCPFCGEKEKLEPRPRGEAERGYHPLPQFYVWCMACRATGPRKDSRIAATRAWNKRAKVDRVPDAVSCGICGKPAPLVRLTVGGDPVCATCVRRGR